MPMWLNSRQLRRNESIVGRAAGYKSAGKSHADVAQLAEQLICNQQVIGSSPIIGFFEGTRVLEQGPLAQLVRAPPCHGGGRGFESHSGRLQETLSVDCLIKLSWDHSSAGRASALQAEGHRFEPYWSH